MQLEIQADDVGGQVEQSRQRREELQAELNRCVRKDVVSRKPYVKKR